MLTHGITATATPFAPRGRGALCLLLGVIGLLCSCASSTPRNPYRNRSLTAPREAEPPSASWQTERARFDALVKKADFQRAQELVERLERSELPREERSDLRQWKSRLRTAAFLHTNPLELRISTEQSLLTDQEGIPLRFEILNLSDLEVSIPAKSSFSWLPGSEKRRSCIHARFTVSAISGRDGALTQSSFDELLELGETWRLAPGCWKARALRLDPPAPPGCVYCRVEVSGELIPGGLDNGSLDWGMIRLSFEPLTVHAVPAALRAKLPAQSATDAAAGAGAGSAATGGALGKEDIEALLVKALVEEGPRSWEAVDRLMRVLPEMDRSLRNAVLSGFRLRSGLDLGYESYRWMDWWELNRDRYLGQGLSPSRPLSNQPAGGISDRYGFLLAACLGSVPGRSTDKPVASSQDADGHSAASLPAEDGPSRMEEGLKDPYYSRRYAARMKLASLGADQGGLLLSLLKDPNPRVRSGAAFALGRSLKEKARAPLADALLSEEDPGAQQAMVQALAELEPLEPDSKAGRKILGDRTLDALYADRLIMTRMEEILHFGGMPGFYDGQFSRLLQSHPDMVDHLVPIAIDPDYTYLVRALAVMALSEGRDPGVLAAVLPLILDPEEELDIEWDLMKTLGLTQASVLAARRRGLSQYARFSLAKAGFPEFNLAKIETLKDWLDQNSDRVFRKSYLFGLDPADDYDPYRLFGKSAMLEIGHNYQQFDSYDEAEHWYLSLLNKFREDKDASYMAEAHYNLACLYAVTHRIDRAIQELSDAIENGFMDVSWMERDRDLDAIRGKPEYAELKQRILHAEPETGNPKKPL